MATKVKSSKSKAPVKETFKSEKEEKVPVKQLLKDERTHKILGTVFLLLAFLLFIAFTSYLFTWAEDQDKFSYSMLLANDIKVQNLLGMLPHATHDLLLISDSNVRAPRHYLRELVALHAGKDVGMVTNLFAGTGERSLGAALENVQLNGFVAAGSALPTLSGDAAVIGKSTLFSRAALEGLGGMSRLSCVLAEDFVLGKMFQNAGQRVLIAPTVLESPNRHRSLRAVFSRHLRWSMLRWRLRPAAALLEPLTSPLLMLPFAHFVFGHFAWLWLVALLAVRDLGGWVLLRGWGRAWIPVLLGPARELAAPFAWLIGTFKRHVSWRGQRLRLSSGTLLYAERPAGR